LIDRVVTMLFRIRRDRDVEDDSPGL